jgi:hypothetical protein
MTTSKDNFKARTEKEGLGLGAELTVGVPDNGMQNASGDYPKREYNFGSSINKAALGTKVNKLYTGGGDINVPLNIPEQMPSQYPFNQVDETPSGHVIEMDDTPGGERVLIKHRKGSGVELRADGTVVISALNNKVEVTGGDQTVIVEGHGNLVYNGNLNLKVSGDMNVDVGGDYNLNVAGNREDNTRRNYKKQVTGDVVESILGTKTQKTIGNSVLINLGDFDHGIKGTADVIVEGNYEVSSHKEMLLSSTDRLDAVARKVRVTGSDRLDIQGSYGTIGGAFTRFTGQTYSGALKKRDYTAEVYTSGVSATAARDSANGPVTGATLANDATNLDSYDATSQDFETAIFHGSLYGTAKKAQLADNANKSITAFFSATAAAPFVAPPGGLTILRAADVIANFNLETEGGHFTVEPDNVAKIYQGTVSADDASAFEHLQGKPMNETSVDAGDFMRDEMKGKEHYVIDGVPVFDREPSVAEIRSAFRNQTSRGQDTPSEVGSLLILEGLLNPLYQDRTCPRIGRTVGSEPTSKYGYTAIGNSIENRGKRFRK